MERRGSTRRAVSLDTVLYHEQLGLLRCKVRDISPEGMFIDTGSVLLPPGTPVQVALMVPGGTHSTASRLQARVRHAEGSGSGLCFVEFDPDALRTLCALCRSCETDDELTPCLRDGPPSPDHTCLVFLACGQP